MAHYQVKRNIPFELKLLLIILVISTFIALLTLIKFEISEEFEDVVAKTIPVEITRTELIENESIKTNVTYIYEDLNYTVLKFKELDIIEKNNKNYAIQTYEIHFEEDVSLCMNLTYKFYENYILVNSEDETHCFRNVSSKKLNFQEIYVGNQKNLNFELNITSIPKIKREIFEKYVVSIPNYVNITLYENKTYYINETKTRTYNKTLISILFN